MINKLKSTISKHLTNARGWRTKRRIIVIESDDWGSIRIPSSIALDKLKVLGFAVDKCQYMQNDCLESNQDLSILFDLLSSRKNKPVITANFLTANPDFEKIEKSDFRKYFNEPLERTLSQYPNHDRVKSLWLEGKASVIFKPQLHGREHLNIGRWMNDLQRNNIETHQAFKEKIFGVSAHIVKQKRGSYQAAFDKSPLDPLYLANQIIKDAVNEFQRLFSFSPKTFIAPNYIWGKELEKTTSELGITHLQGTRTQRFPKNEKGKTLTKQNILGHKNNYNQTYLIRNCTFEPFSNPDKDWVNHALKDISTAFLWNKPATITMHRVNFVGGINVKNRERNIYRFKCLLDEIDKKWPNVEYMSSDQLAKII